MYSTGWHREDTQKPRDRILGWTKSAQSSGGSFPDLDYKHIDFTPHFIYLLVLQTLIKAYYVPSCILDTKNINMSGPYSQNPLVKWETNKQAVYLNSM